MFPETYSHAYRPSVLLGVHHVDNLDASNTTPLNAHKQHKKYTPTIQHIGFATVAILRVESNAIVKNMIL